MERQISQLSEQFAQIGIKERVLSAIGGGLLFGYGLVNSSKMRVPMLIAGAALLARGLSGYSLIYRLLHLYRAQGYLQGGLRIEQDITIQQPVEDVFAFWMALENLPRFMGHLEMVSVRDDGTSHWVAKAPLGTRVEWDAHITDLVPGEFIAWRSLPGSQINNAGEVRFRPAPDERGTNVHVLLEYQVPGGPIGSALARLLGEEPELQVREDLGRLKALLETA
jgi:uncharacterized membrane protein